MNETFFRIGNYQVPIMTTFTMIIFVIHGLLIALPVTVIGATGKEYTVGLFASFLGVNLPPISLGFVAIPIAIFFCCPRKVNEVDEKDCQVGCS